jgi:hypothetical protein
MGTTTGTYTQGSMILLKALEIITYFGDILFYICDVNKETQREMLDNNYKSP